MAMTQEQAAQALQSSGVSVFGLQVQDMGPVVKLSGTVGSEADKQKAQQALEASGAKVANHLEVQASSAGSAATSGAAGGGGQKYTVKSGDNLRRIAQQFYGDEMKWHAIRDANRDKLPNPDKIQAGMELVIP